MPLGKLRRALRRAKITQLDVAIEAHVTQSCVNHVLRGRAKSENVLRAAWKLLARKRDNQDERKQIRQTVLKSRGQE